MLPGLDHNIEECLGKDIYKPVQMHVVITFVVDQAGLFEVFNDLGICGIYNMAPISGKDRPAFEPVGDLRERRREFLKKIFEGGRANLFTPLDKGRLRGDTIRIKIKIIVELIRGGAFPHGKNQAHCVIKV